VSGGFFTSGFNTQSGVGGCRFCDFKVVEYLLSGKVLIMGLWNGARVCQWLETFGLGGSSIVQGVGELVINSGMG